MKSRGVDTSTSTVTHTVELGVIIDALFAWRLMALRPAEDERSGLHKYGSSDINAKVEIAETSSYAATWYGLPPRLARDGSLLVQRSWRSQQRKQSPATNEANFKSIRLRDPEEAEEDTELGGDRKGGGPRREWQKPSYFFGEQTNAAHIASTET